MNRPPMSVTDQTITVIFDGKPYSVKTGDLNWTLAKDAITHQNWDRLYQLVARGRIVEDWSEGEFTFEDNRILYGDDPVPAELSETILGMIKDGIDPQHLLNFWKRLSRNPSHRSVTQLYRFIRQEGIPIGPDGYIYAYKGVREDYKDQHSNQYDNTPGAKHSVPRNKVSDDPRLACSYGFHAGTRHYASGYGTRIVIVRIDPEHVVSVPYDSAEKIRLCAYEVVSDFHQDLPSFGWAPPSMETNPTSEATSSHFDDDDEEENDEWEEDEYSDEEVIEHSVGDEASPTISPPPSLSRPSPEGDGGVARQAELMSLPLKTLRTYASKVLGITGASKIPGGKTALIDRIITVEAGQG